MTFVGQWTIFDVSERIFVMYCNKCGKLLSDDAKFCDGCGTRIGAAVPRSNPTVDSFLKVFKSFFSKDPVSAATNAAQSTTFEFILLGILSAVVAGFAVSANLSQLFAHWSPICEAFGLSSYSFGMWLLFGFIFSIVTFCIMSCVLFFAVKIAKKDYVSVRSVFNVVAVGSLPLTITYAVNIGVGFIWMPVAVFFTACGLFATVIYTYFGAKKLISSEKEPYGTYIAALSASLLLNVAVCAFIVFAYVSNM